MSIRREPTYLSYEVHRALRLIAKSKSDDQRVSIDQLADGMLLSVISTQYPQLLNHQKEIEKLEREVIKTL